jgi:hypothetical protein
MHDPSDGVKLEEVLGQIGDGIVSEVSQAVSFNVVYKGIKPLIMNMPR